jgi:hypothetical protein
MDGYNKDTERGTRMIIRGKRYTGWPRKSLFSQVLEDSMKRDKSWLEIEKKSCRKQKRSEIFCQQKHG